MTNARQQRPATAARHRDLHDRLVEAADAAIDSGGLGNLKARTLADTVGCSLGAIYGVFPDLHGLILTVNARTLGDIEATMRSLDDGSDAAGHIVRLATAYLDYAATHRHRWRALFDHKLPEDYDLPPWYADLQAKSFAHIEAPLARLRPALTGPERVLLARTMFSAVHGMIDLGLNEKLIEMPGPLLRSQVEIVTSAMAQGLSA